MQILYYPQDTFGLVIAIAKIQLEHTKIPIFCFFHMLMTQRSWGRIWQMHLHVFPVPVFVSCVVRFGSFHEKTPGAIGKTTQRVLRGKYIIYCKTIMIGSGSWLKAHGSWLMPKTKGAWGPQVQVSSRFFFLGHVAWAMRLNEPWAFVGAQKWLCRGYGKIWQKEWVCKSILILTLRSWRGPKLRRIILPHIQGKKN